jgi:hypothetical protein
MGIESQIGSSHENYLTVTVGPVMSSTVDPITRSRS